MNATIASGVDAPMATVPVVATALPASTEAMTNVVVATNATLTADSNQEPSTPLICRYYLRGVCRFGALCRFSHDLHSLANTISEGDLSAFDDSIVDQQKPSTSRKSNWADAPVFVPTRAKTTSTIANVGAVDADCFNGDTHPDNKTWAEVVGHNGSVDMVCPYESPCPYGETCFYTMHWELCKMCDQYCLHPKDQAQRRKHNQECLQQHEQAMELSFAIARSKDKTCGICFDTIMEKVGREKRFGILPNCSHIFCLECIRKWRQAKQFEHKITRSCPECRVASDFVCPSAYWVETKEEKDKLLTDYRSALGIKDCKYFKKGDGKCPFGNKCFYKHALPNGELVDVGCPKRSRKLHRSPNEIIDLLDIYLWEYVDHRDYHWLDLLESDDSDDSDWSQDL